MYFNSSLVHAGKEGKYRAKEEDVEFHKTHNTDLNAPHQLRPQRADMEVEQDLEVHSEVTEDLQEYTVHGGLKITNEHGHRKFVPYKAVAEGGHGTEVRNIGLLSCIKIRTSSSFFFEFPSMFTCIALW